VVNGAVKANGEDRADRTAVSDRTDNANGSRQISADRPEACEYSGAQQ